MSTIEKMKERDCYKEISKAKNELKGHMRTTKMGGNPAATDNGRAGSFQLNELRSKVSLE